MLDKEAPLYIKSRLVMPCSHIVAMTLAFMICRFRNIHHARVIDRGQRR